MDRSLRLLITIATSAALRPLIIFGRPGAGKSTIAEQLVAHPDANAYNVDLDVCVPQWMRDNFARGIYPTLAERQAFASDAAEYVSTESAGKGARCVVSFSFVNDDLRDSFRARFPEATWALVDASDALAGEGYRNATATSTTRRRRGATSGFSRPSSLSTSCWTRRGPSTKTLRSCCRS